MELLHHHQPHAVMFPFPAQGHVNPMLQLAHRLLSSGFFVTFVNTDFNHQRMFDGGASQILLQLPSLHFEHLPDGLPPSHGRFNQSVPECVAAIAALEKPFTKLVEKIIAAGTSAPPLTCIVVDSFCSWMQNVADRFGVARVSLWTTPIHANIAYHSQSYLISRGYIPLKDKEKASEIISCIPGVAQMALSEYPSFFQVETIDYMFQWLLNDCMKRSNEAAWNLGNNILEMEAEAAEVFQKEVKNFLPIGPLLPEAVLKAQGCRGGVGLSMWAEESDCGTWLDMQKERSVLYISYGSVANMGEEQLEEIVKGVEESGVPFLWAVRSDQLGETLERLQRRVAEGEEISMRAKMVGWVPQLEVLTHNAVGGFLSHCGWNSVLESICAGVPILAAMGGFAEQKMNAHYITNVWRIGLPLPPAPGRDIITTQIRTLFSESQQAIDLRRRLTAIRKTAIAAVTLPSGSSINNFHLFVEDMQRRCSSLVDNLVVSLHSNSDLASADSWCC